MHDLFSSQAELTPQATAVVSESGVLTYAELAARAGRLSGLLRDRGAGPEAVVALCLERSPDMVVAILGALGAGAAYLPLDPRDPPGRLAALLDDAGVRICLTQPAPADRLPGGRVELLTPADWEAGRARAPVAVSSGHLAYVMYTSGSTGRPKGVMVEQRSILNRLDWFRREHGIGPGDVFLQKTPYTFDVSVPELLCPLLSGARLVQARPDGHRDAAYLCRLVQETGVTTVHFVPSMLSAALEEPDLGRCRSLRRVLCSGEALAPALRDRFLQVMAGTGCRLVNLYGPTETAVEVTAAVCGPEPGASVVPIGRALPGVRLQVLDRELRPVARGEPGELCVGGVQVARGYLGRGGPTAAAFVPDPAGGGERLYRTGDLVRERPDGTLEFHGRRDDQVKVRGFRVEPGEVEAHLAEHPDVRSAAVVAVPGRAGDARLVAWVVARAEVAPAAPADLAAFLGLRLPAHMVPSRFLARRELPLTVSGKLDRRALTAAAAAGEPPEPPVPPAPDEPRTPVERELSAIWEDVLGSGPVGRQRDFTELGGHSLDAARVLSRINRRLGVRLEVRDVFQAGTVAALAGRVEAAPPAREADGPRPVPGPPVLSMSQRRLWFVDQVAPGATAYNMAVAARLRGDLSSDSLAWALAELVRRHDALRSAFPSPEGEPRLELLEPWSVELDPADAPAGGVEAALESFAAQPFDLARGPLFRARVLRLADRDHVLALVMHHAVSDGWSLGVLFRELSALYRAHVERAPSPLPDLPLQFPDFAAWQRRRLAGPALDRLVEAWRRRLTGAPAALELPADRPRPAAASQRGQRRWLVVPRALADAVERLGRRLGATPFVTLLAAFGVLLGRLSGDQDVVVGTPVAGRDHPDLERLIGCFVNMLPLRLDLAGDPSFERLVVRVGETMLDALERPDVPFEVLVDRLRVERHLSRAPLFQVVFNMYSFDAPRLELPGLQAETLDEATPGSQVDLTLYVQRHGAGLRFDAVYSPDLFDAARVDEMLRQYVHLLAQVVEAPERPIGRFSLVTGMSRTVLPDPTAPLPVRSLPSLLDRLRGHAAAAPERPALIDRGRALTYAELERASGRAAALLRGLGAGRGRVVAVLGERSPWLAVAVLAVLRAGAAFLILDRAIPPGRLLDHVRRARPAAWIELPRSQPGIELGAGLGGLPRLRLPAPDGPVEPVPEPAPDDLAYVAFTSGSTGWPRGVLGTHAPLRHFLAWYEAEFGLGPDDRFAMLAGLAHDPLLRDLLAPVWSGGALCVPAAESWPASEALARWLDEAGVRVAHLTPLQARMLAAAAPAGLALPALRLVCFGGDVLTRRDAGAVARLAPGARLVDFYGTTETPQAVAWLELPSPPPAGRPAVPVGRGIEGVQLLVLDGDRQAGIGELGEVCVRTPYLAAGYLEGPAGGFGRNPLTGDAGDRMYRTGDLGRYLPDGGVELAGRRDRQVKIRGVRVEPAEVERELRDLPQVAEAAVTAVERGGERALVGYVVTRWPAAPAELRAQLRHRLPDHLVPGELVAVERLPVTPNGKLDTPVLTGAGAEGPSAGTVERARDRARSRLRPPERRAPVGGGG